MKTVSTRQVRHLIAGYTIIVAKLATMAACTDNVVATASAGGNEPTQMVDAGGQPDTLASGDAGSATPNDAGEWKDAQAEPDVDGGLPSGRSLVLWLDPGRGTTTDEVGVTEWRDQSPAKTPTTIGGSASVYRVGPNEPPMISLGASMPIGVTLASPIGTRAFSFIFVARLYSSDSATLFRSNDGDPSFAFTMSGTNRLWITAPHENGGGTFRFNPSTPDPTGALHVFTLRRSGNVYDVRVDGIGQSAADAAGAYRLPAGISLFGKSPSHYMAVGDVLIYDADLNDGTLLAAEDYLKAKYNM